MIGLTLFVGVVIANYMENKVIYLLFIDRHDKCVSVCMSVCLCVWKGVSADCFVMFINHTELWSNDHYLSKNKIIYQYI